LTSSSLRSTSCPASSARSPRSTRSPSAGACNAALGLGSSLARASSRSPRSPTCRASGGLREATRADYDLLVDWFAAFGREALHDGEPGLEQHERQIRMRLDSTVGGIGLWEDDGDVVSLCGYGSPTPSGIRIGPVYTPPELRGRGYATTLTADVSAAQLARGRRFCFLYTDLANPTSNAIYERIGYVRVCESKQLAFERD